MVVIKVTVCPLAHRHDAWDEPFVNAAAFDKFYIESSQWLMQTVHVAGLDEEELSQSDRQSISSHYDPNVAWHRVAQ